MKLVAKYYSIVDCDIGEDTIVREFVNLYGCRIGRECRIAAFVEIQRGVTIGDRCKVEAFAFIPSGVTIEDEVFIGPRVTFTNDLHPHAVGDWTITPTVVKKGASVGAGAVVVCGDHRRRGDGRCGGGGDQERCPRNDGGREPSQAHQVPVRCQRSFNQP